MNNKPHRASDGMTNLGNALVEDLANISDDDLMEDVRAVGGDPEAEAAELRALMRRAIKGCRQKALAAAAAAYRQDVRELHGVECEVPGTAEAKRELLEVYLTREASDGGASITAQYRDLTRLSDGDVDSLLRNFMKLEAMSAFAQPRGDADSEQ